MLECREERLLQRLHKQLDRLSLLILDEQGYVPFSKAGAKLPFEVVGRAYEHQSLMVTQGAINILWMEASRGDLLPEFLPAKGRVSKLLASPTEP